MPKSEMQKLKLLYLMKIFEENTNENHALTMEQIIGMLAGCGIKAERKSVYSDIEYLRLFGLDIVGEKSDKFRYFMGSRRFETAELKILTDSVLASKSITRAKSEKLVEKLEALTDKYEASKLRRQMFFTERIKADNEGILYNIDTICNAVSMKRQISFKYFEYTTNKTRQFRNDGNLYKVSPYALTVSEDNYYLIAYYPKRDKLASFRVDRMSMISAEEEECKVLGGESETREIIAQYIKKNFKMFAGESCVAELLCENSMINAVIDRFGESVSVSKADEEHFKVHAKVTVSPTFFSWVFTFGGKIKIISPEFAVKEFNDMIAAFR